MRKLVLLLVLLFSACHVDRKFDNEDQKAPRKVKCEGTAYHLDLICEDEREYLDWAKKSYPEYPRFQDLTEEALHKITIETKDVDKAAAIFYQRNLLEPRSAELLNFLDAQEKILQKKVPDYSRKKVLLALVPGMFWMDNPEVGAAGGQLRDLADQLGLKGTIVPIEQTGPVDQNGKDICEFLDKQTDVEGIVVASISKGGGDMKMAIKHCPNGPGMKKVRAWFNVGGINNGSELIKGIDNNFLYKTEARAYFCYNGYNWEGMRSIGAFKDAPLEFNLEVPKHILVVNVVAVPLFRHVSSRARPFYEYLIQYGPNDGISLLSDSYIPGGINYLAFRNDHYFRVPMSEQRMQAFLVYIMNKQFP